MYGIGKLFNTKYGGLIFSLFGGTAYFMLALSFLSRYSPNGGILLGFFFFPAITCGMAVILLKAVKRLQDEERYRQINLLAYMHIVLFLISIVFLIDIIK